MKFTMNLDSGDMERIIAKHFGVESTSVRVYIEEKLVGYGTGEKMARVPACSVESKDGHFKMPQKVDGRQHE